MKSLGQRRKFAEVEDFKSKIDELRSSHYALLECMQNTPVPVFAFQENKLFYINQAALGFFNLQNKPTKLSQLLKHWEYTPPLKEILDNYHELESAYHLVKKSDIGIPETFQLHLIDDQLDNLKIVIFLRRTYHSVDLQKHALETSNMPWFWYNQESEILYVNEAACHMLGYTQKELRQKRICDIIIDWNQESWQKHWDELEEKKSIFLQSSLYHKDGKEIPIEVMSEIHEFSDASIAISQVVDISEQKFIESALIIGEQNYREIFNSSADAIFIHDAKTGQIIDVNETMLDLYGCSYEEALAMTSKLSWSKKEPYTEKHVHAKLQEAREKGMTRFEWLSTKYHGEEFWSEITLKLVKLNGIDRILAMERDITASKKARLEIEQRHQFEKMIIDIWNLFINMKPEKVEAAINASLKEICQFIDASSLLLYRINEGSEKVALQNYCSSKAVELESFEMEAWHMARLRDNRVIDSSTLADAPYLFGWNPNEVSWLDVGLYNENQLQGFMRIVSKNKDRVWNNDEAKLLQMTGEIFLNTLMRNSAIQSLKTSEQTYKEIYNATREAIFVHDAQTGQIQDVNKAMLDMFGYSYEEALQVSISDISAGGQYSFENGLALIHKALKEPQIFEWHSLKKNGDKFWCEISLFKAEIHGKEKVLAVVRDIHERKKTRELLLENEERFRTIVQQLSDLVLLIDPETTILYETPSVTKILGYPEGQLIGTKGKDIIHPDDLEIMEHELNLVLNSQNDFIPTELRLKHQNGHYIYVEVIGNNMMSHPTIKGIVVSCREITERKNLEKRILDAVIKTEENERERFAKDLHDDLGPLLSSLKMYISMMKSVDSEKRDFVIEQLEDIVKEAIITTKNVSNDLSPHILTNYGLASAIENFISKISNQISIKFKNGLDDNRYTTIVETSLYRIVKELINNTIKHAKASNIRISLKEESSKIILNYSDNGIGIEEGSIENMKGKGMGFSNIVSRSKSLNANYKFNSKSNKGLEFQLRVPVNQ